MRPGTTTRVNANYIHKSQSSRMSRFTASEVMTVPRMAASMFPLVTATRLVAPTFTILVAFIVPGISDWHHPHSQPYDQLDLSVVITRHTIT